MAVSGFASSILSKIHEIVSGSAVSVLHSYNGRNDAMAGPSNMIQIQVLLVVSVNTMSNLNPLFSFKHCVFANIFLRIKNFCNKIF